VLTFSEVFPFGSPKGFLNDQHSTKLTTSCPRHCTFTDSQRITQCICAWKPLSSSYSNHLSYSATTGLVHDAPCTPAGIIALHWLAAQIQGRLTNTCMIRTRVAFKQLFAVSFLLIAEGLQVHEISMQSSAACPHRKGSIG